MPARMFLSPAHLVILTSKVILILRVFLILKLVLELEVMWVVNVILMLGITLDVVACFCQPTAPPKR